MSGHLSKEELRAIKVPEDTTCWEWLEENYFLDASTSAMPGPYNPDVVPAFKIVAEWIDDDKIAEIYWRKSGQEGATTFAIGAFLYRQDLSPGPAMITLADQTTAENMNQERLSKAVESSPAFEGVEVEIKKKKTSLSTGGSFRATWASSDSSMASHSDRDLIMDEVCKESYRIAAKHGDVVGRGLTRLTAYPNSKAIITSTVTHDGDVMSQLEKTIEARFLPYAECPFCGSPQPLFFFRTDYTLPDGQKRKSGQVVWDNSLESLEDKAQTARYQCQDCEELWDNLQKNEAIQTCMGVSNGPANLKSPVRFLETWRIWTTRKAGNLEEITRAWLKCGNNPLKKKQFYNDVIGQYWSDTVKKLDEMLFEYCRLDYGMGEIPDDENIKCLIATVDVQKKGFYYIVRAWTNTERSYKIEHRYIESEAELDQVIFVKTWKRADGKYMGVWRAGLDTGGGEKEDQTGAEKNSSSTQWAYRWYRKNKGKKVQLILCKGASKSFEGLTKKAKGKVTNKRGKVIEELRIRTINTLRTKILFVSRLKATEEAEAECAAFCSRELEENADYFKHLQAEELKRVKNKVQWVQIKDRNDYFDCESMQVAIASEEIMGGVAILEKPVVVLDSPRKEPTTKKRRVKRKKTTWKFKQSGR